MTVLESREMVTQMSCSSASTRHRETSRHELCLIWIAVVFSVIAIVPVLAGKIAGEWAGFWAGAAGVASVRFAWSESRSSGRPLTLGHQLVFWWFWALVLPVFAIATRGRRQASTSVLLVMPFFILTLGFIIVFIVDCISIPR